MSPRVRSFIASATLFAILAIGALTRINRLAHEAARGDDRFLTLGQLARQFASENQTFELVLGKLGAGPKSTGLIGEVQVAAMRKMFELGDYSGLDLEPRVTLEDLRAALEVLANKRGPVVIGPRPAPARQPLGLPTGKPGPVGEPYLTDLGLGVSWGDRLDLQKAKHAEDSNRLAAVLDGLALGTLTLEEGWDSPSALLEGLVKAGHTVVVLDQRLAANFGDLERKGKPVATPLWVATGRKTAAGEEVWLPVPHAQLVLQVRGPKVNADVTLYPALDLGGDGSGGLRFRGDVTTDQVWCGGRILHRYEKFDAITAVQWMTVLRQGFEAKVREKALPLDGYFALGVCTLAPAIVEQALTGSTTVWPLTHDPALFGGDSELDKAVRTLPHDGRGASAPTDARLAASLPWATLAEVPFPRLRAQVAELKLLPAR